MLPVRRSRIRKKKGWSAWKITGGAATTAVCDITTPVAEPIGQVHQVDPDFVPCRDVEIARSGVIRPERRGPEGLEVDCIGEDQEGARMDLGRLEQVLDLPAGLLLDPGVDGPSCLLS